MAFGRLGDLLPSSQRGEEDVVPDFEVFTRRMIPLVKGPTVTLQKRGTMSFNKAAHVAMGSPEAVELLYDRTSQIIGIRPVAPEVDHAYPMRPQANKEDGPYIVSGSAFTKYYGIDTTEARRWSVVIEDGVLLIDLNAPGVVVTSNRNGSASREESRAATD
jgi:hypothetical protein